MSWQITPEFTLCIDTCQELFWCFETEGDGFIRIVTGDEIWVHYSEQGIMPSLLTEAEEVSHADLQGKLCLFFWDQCGFNLEHYCQEGTPSPVLRIQII